MSIVASYEQILHVIPQLAELGKGDSAMSVIFPRNNERDCFLSTWHDMT